MARLRHSRRFVFGAALPVALAAFEPPGALAEPVAESEQATNAGVVEDVVVSSSSDSQKQAAALQNKPTAATIITRDQIENAQITNLESARKLAPSLTIRWNNIQNLTYNIRGIGNASSTQLDTIYPGVPIYIDGVYLPRPGTWTVDIPDLNGIQVLKGPQGTRGGFDSTGGAVYVTTTLPSFTSQTFAEISYGTYNFVQFKGSVTGPLFDSDQVAFRLSVFGKDRDGYIQSTTSGFRFQDWHDKGVRAQLLVQPNNDFVARFILDWSQDVTRCCVRLTNGAMTHFANGAPLPNNIFVRSARVGYSPINLYGFANYSTDLATATPSESAESYGATALLSYNWNDYTFSSITAFRQYDYHPRWLNNTLINVDTNTASHGHPVVRSLQHEMKIATPVGEPIEATAGLFYYWESFRTWTLSSFGNQAGVWFGNPTTPEATAIANVALNGLGRDGYSNPETHSIAPYGQAVWHATPEVDITAGFRYSYTDRAAINKAQVYGQPLDGLTPAQQASALALRAGTLGPPSWHYFDHTRNSLYSGLISASYKFTPEVTGYVTYSHGVRPGGPNDVYANYRPAGAGAVVKPEELDNYEIGLKSEWFDGRLLANFAGFWMVDHNYITNVASLTSTGTTIAYLANAKRAISRGFEADLRAQPFEGLNLYGSATFNDAYFSSFDSAPCPIEESNVFKTCNFSGRRLAIVPRWAFSVGGNYSHSLGFDVPFVEQGAVGFVGADFNWQSSFFSDTSDSIYSVIHPYGLLNVNIGVKTADESWKLTGWIHNALDKRYFTNLSATTTVGAGLIGGSVGDPLLAGVSLAAKW
jgi:iron complex outermembrane receptor protein